MKVLQGGHEGSARRLSRFCKEVMKVLQGGHEGSARRP